MTLKTDYTNQLNTSLGDAELAGIMFIINNKTLLSSSLISFASSGQKSFIIFIETSYLPEALKLKGNLLNAYLKGAKDELTNTEGFTSTEVVLSLDTSVVGVNKIKFSFTFA